MSNPDDDLRIAAELMAKWWQNGSQTPEFYKNYVMDSHCNHADALAMVAKARELLGQEAEALRARVAELEAQNANYRSREAAWESAQADEVPVFKFGDKVRVHSRSGFGFVRYVSPIGRVFVQFPEFVSHEFSASDLTLAKDDDNE